MGASASGTQTGKDRPKAARRSIDDSPTKLVEALEPTFVKHRKRTVAPGSGLCCEVMGNVFMRQRLGKGVPRLMDVRGAVERQSGDCRLRGGAANDAGSADDPELLPAPKAKRLGVCRRFGAVHPSPYELVDSFLDALDDLVDRFGHNAQLFPNTV